MNDGQDRARGPLTIRGWTSGDGVFETHEGQPIVLPKHLHETYQIALSTRSVGQYRCDGRQVHAGPGTLLVICPGEVHWTDSHDERVGTGGSRLLYLSPHRVQRIAMDLGLQMSAERPLLHQRVIDDRTTIDQFIRAHELSHGGASTLEKESALQAFVATWLTRHAGLHARCDSAKRDRRCAVMARDFIQAHFSEEISLAYLAEVCCSSPHHLNRMFAKAFGLPPHAFQNNLRIGRAKQLLLDGATPIDVALATGFYDHSHFIRRFRQLVGVTPSGYVQQARR